MSTNNIGFYEEISKISSSLSSNSYLISSSALLQNNITIKQVLYSTCKSIQVLENSPKSYPFIEVDVFFCELGITAQGYNSLSVTVTHSS